MCDSSFLETVFAVDLLFRKCCALFCEKLWTGDGETNRGNEPWANNCVLRAHVAMHCITGDEGKDNTAKTLFTHGDATPAF